VNLTHRRRRLTAAFLAALLTLAGILTSTVARGEEKGIVVSLSYIRGYSNWGPTNVYGTAQLWPQEGVAVLAVHNLPHLLNDDKYAGWIVNTVSGDALLLDTFNTSEAGDGSIDVIFDQSVPRGANAVVVTVMHPGDPAGLPGPQRTLSGIFPAQSRPSPKTAILAKSPKTKPPIQMRREKLKARPVHGAPRRRPQVHVRVASEGKHAVARTQRQPVALPHTGGGWLLRKQHAACSERARHRLPCPPTTASGDVPAARPRSDVPLLTRLY